MVWDLLNLHPDVGTAAPIYEDSLVASIAELDRYVDVAAAGWAPRWNVAATERDRLARSLVDGVVRFVADLDDGDVIIAKTPSLMGVERFLELAPSNARLVIVTRAPYPTVRSAVRTFGWRTSKAIKRWEVGGRVVAKILESHGEASDTHLVIRYEDLVDDRATAVARLLEFAGLDRQRYPIDDAHRLAVRGASSMVGDRGTVSWSDEASASFFRLPAESQAESHADVSLRCEVDRTLGAVAKQLGYEPSSSGRLHPVALKVANVRRDVRSVPRQARRVYNLGITRSETVRRSRAKLFGRKS